MVEETVEVTVKRLAIRLLKVTFTGGYQLVVGGRLVLECRNSEKTAHPELPEYTPEMFPVPFSEWADDETWDASPVSVTIAKPGGKEGKRRQGPVRACTLLFTPMPVQAVVDWLRGQGKEANNG